MTSLGNAYFTMTEVVNNIIEGQGNMSLITGKVVSVNPLKISIGNSYVLEEADLELAPFAMDINVPITIIMETTATDERHGHRYTYQNEHGVWLQNTSEEGVRENGDYVVPPLPKTLEDTGGEQLDKLRGSLSHFHPVIGTFDAILHFAPAVGDYVKMIKYPGGQRWLVLYKVQGGAAYE